MKKLFYLLSISIFILSFSTASFGQISISGGSTVTESFTIGTSATANLPANWKADKNATVRTLGTYSAAVTKTDLAPINPVSSTASNGIQNFVSTSSSTDRCIGWISSSSATKSGNLYTYLINNGTSQISSFTISYNVEKYRNGSNTAGFSIQMYYSTDGTTWTSAGSNFLTSFTANADNNGYATAPGTTVNITNQTLNVSVNAGSVIYLAWNYSVTSGTTTSNAQGLGIDDVSITAVSSVTSSVNITSPTIASGFVDQGAVNCVLMRYDLAVTSANAILNGLTITTGGNYTDADVTNFKVRYSNDVVLDAGDATLSTYVNTSPAGTIVFPSFTSQSITMGTTGYIFVTADISSTATDGNNVSVSTTPFSNISFSGTVNKTGTDPVAAGGLQTFQSVIPNVTISSSNPAVTAGNITQNTTNNVIYMFSLFTEKANATLTGLKINTAGTYVSGDISSLKAWYSSDNTFSAANDVLLSTLTPVSGPGEKVFSEWTNQVLTNGNTGYIFITADIPCSGIYNNTINVSAVTTGDITLANGDLTGTTFASASQTIQYSTPGNPFVNTISSTSSGTLTLPWNNPSGCFDEIMIVASTSTITDVPSGNGSAYSPNLNFGSGTPFGTGFVVYKGITSPQTVTGLTAGSTYYFKFFTRNGTSWSTGYEKSSFLAAPINPADIFISHLSSQFNGATDEFVVLFNNTANPIDLNGYELKYYASSGNAGSALCTFNTSTIIQSKKHLLLSPVANITVGSVISKARDLAMSSGLANNGQLVLRQTADTTVKIFAVAWGTIAGYVAGMTDAALWPEAGMISLTPSGNTYIYSGSLDYNFSNSAYTHTPSASIFNIPNAGDGTLPVHLTSLNSFAAGRDIIIKWTTESELNNAGFEIERKFSDGNWISAGYVKGSGTTNTNIDYSFTDKKLSSGKYEYRIKQIDLNGKYTYYKLQNSIEIGIPGKFNLSQNYPNPFNPVTKIDFDLPFDSKVRISVYDMIGREVKTLIAGEIKTAGFYTVDLNALNLSSGTYFYRMIANSQGKEYIFTKKMTVIK